MNSLQSGTAFLLHCSRDLMGLNTFYELLYIISRDKDKMPRKTETSC